MEPENTIMDPVDQEALIRRVRDQLAFEINGDVPALYAMIDPVIRAKMEQERDGEPARTLSGLTSWADWVHSAEIRELEITGYLRESPGRQNRPVATFQLLVDYNHGDT